MNTTIGYSGDYMTNETDDNINENSKHKKFKLVYDMNKWKERITDPVPTLQLFITNKCNKRCAGCFYEESLGNEEMPLNRYKEIINEYKTRIKKVILLGGEPTIHKDVDKMISFNMEQNLKTTVYTNGKDLKKLEDIHTEDIRNGTENNLDVRIGILGLYHGEKNLAEIKKT